MKVLPKAGCTALALLPVLAGAGETVGLLRVQPPAGWERQRADDGTSYRAPVHSGLARCHITVRQPHAATGDLDETFRQEWAATTASLSAAAQPPQPQHRDWLAGWRSAWVALAGTHSQLWLVTLSDGARAQAVLASGEPGCRPAFTAFFDALALAAPAAAAAPAPPSGAVPAGLAGWWTGRRSSTATRYRYTNKGPALDGMMPTVVVYDLVLRPDGQYFETAPQADGWSPPAGGRLAGRYEVSRDGRTLWLHNAAGPAAPTRLELRQGVPWTTLGPMERKR